MPVSVIRELRYQIFQLADRRFEIRSHPILRGEILFASGGETNLDELARADA